MDSRTGKAIRRARLISPDSRRGIVIAYSHGVLVGAGPGRENLSTMQARVTALDLAEGIMVSPGLVTALETAYLGRNRPSLVVHMDWKSAGRPLLTPSFGVAASLAAVEDVLAAGADGIMTYMYVGQEDPRLERDEVQRNAELARACDRLGLVLIIEPRTEQKGSDGKERSDAALLSMYSRMAAEIGADIVKCIWPGDSESLRAVTDACTCPVLVAGGSSAGDDRSTLDFAAEVVAGGAAGLMIGRRVYESKQPRQVLRALRAVVHEELPASEAEASFLSGLVEARA